MLGRTDPHLPAATPSFIPDHRPPVLLHHRTRVHSSWPFLCHQGPVGWCKLCFKELKSDRASSKVKEGEEAPCLGGMLLPHSPPCSSQSSQTAQHNFEAEVCRSSTGRGAESPEDNVPAQGCHKGSARMPLSQTSKSSHFRGDLSLLPWAQRWLGQGPQDQCVLSRVRLWQLSKDRWVWCQPQRSRMAQIRHSREGAGLQCSPTGAGRYPVLPSVHPSPNAAN